MGVCRSQQTLSRSSTLPYDHKPQRAQPQRGGGAKARTRPASPGSEMVTLEEFLQESNLKSPPMVRPVCVGVCVCGWVCVSWKRLLLFIYSFLDVWKWKGIFVTDAQPLPLSPHLSEQGGAVCGQGAVLSAPLWWIRTCSLLDISLLP